MSTEVATFDIKVTGGDKGAAQTEKVAAGFRKLQQAANDNNKTFNVANERFAKLSSVLSSIDPNVSKLVGTLGRASGAAGALASTLGGPLGVAIGLVAGATALWTDYTDQQAKKLEDLKKAADEAAKSIKTLDDYISELGKQRREQSIQQQLAMGVADPDVINARLRQIDDEFKKSSGDSIKQNALIREQNDLIAALKANEGIDAQGAEDELNDPGEKKKKTGTKAPSIYGQQSAAANQLEALRAAGDARKSESERQLKALEQVKTYYAAQEAEFERGEADRRRAARELEYEGWKRDREQRMELIRQQAEEEARLEEQAAQKRKVYQDLAIAGAQNVAGNMASALQKMAKGQKVTTAAVLESIGDQAFADGTFRVLQGIALSVINPAQGLPLIAAGGAEAAFGLALGAAAARGAGGSASAGARGRSGGGSGYGAEPTTLRAQSGGSSEPRTVRENIVVNVNTLVADDRTGLAVADSLEAARRRHGRTLSRDVVGRA